MNEGKLPALIKGAQAVLSIDAVYVSFWRSFEMGPSKKKGQPIALFKAARQAANHAHAPYSRFAVGAAVGTSDRRTFVGANMENASYGLTVCAEVGALQAALSAGALGKIRRIAIVGGPIDPAPAYRPKPTAPCGRCRQLIAEAAMASGCDIEVWYADLEQCTIERRTISELLPDAFDAGNLK